MRKKRSPFYSKIDSSSFGIQLYKSETLFSPCYCRRPKSGWIASVALFKFSAEVLRCFEATSRGNVLNWQICKLQKLLGYNKPMMPNVLDGCHFQFAFEQVLYYDGFCLNLFPPTFCFLLAAFSTPSICSLQGIQDC